MPSEPLDLPLNPFAESWKNFQPASSNSWTESPASNAPAENSEPQSSNIAGQPDGESDRMAPQTSDSTPTEILDIARQLRNQKEADSPYGASGLCFAWNLDLAFLLQAHGYSPKFIHGFFQTDRKGPIHHYWVEMDGLVVDISADQFNRMLYQALPPVNVGPKSPRYQTQEDQSFRLKTRF